MALMLSSNIVFFLTKIFLHFFISIVTKNMSVSWQSAVSGNPKILDICFVRQKFFKKGGENRSKKAGRGVRRFMAKVINYILFLGNLA